LLFGHIHLAEILGLRIWLNKNNALKHKFLPNDKTKNFCSKGKFWFFQVTLTSKDMFLDDLSYLLGVQKKCSFNE